jgi:hypothetical protein
MKIKSELLQYVRPQSPRDVRLKAARADLVLKPEDLVTVLFILSRDHDPEIAGAASTSMTTLGPATLVAALSRELEPRIIKAAVRTHKASEAVLAMAVLNPSSDEDTLEYIAGNAPPAVVDIICTGEGMVRFPKLLDALKANPNASKAALNVAAERLGVRRAHEPAPEAEETPLEPLAVVVGEGGAGGEGDETEPTPEEIAAVDESRLPKKLMDEDGAEVTEKEAQNLYQMVQAMSVAERVKLAMKGNKEARGLLIKQTNKVVSKSVIRNPRITDEEIIKLTQSKSTSDELLREIARNDEWLKNYNIKKGLAFNSKTPVPISLKIIMGLTERDLKDLARSKNVPNVISTAARRTADLKKQSGG